MIELRRPPVDTEADALAATLAELVVAHRIVVDDTLEEPVLADGRWVATDADSREQFMKDLARDLADWGRFQSDSCYVADDGSIC